MTKTEEVDKILKQVATDCSLSLEQSKAILLIVKNLEHKVKVLSSDIQDNFKTIEKLRRGLA